MKEIRAEAARRLEELDGRDPLPEEEATHRRWAIARCTEAIEADPSLADAYVRRGVELYYERRYEDSRSDMRRAFELQPIDPYLYELMTLPFDVEEAEKFNKESVRLEHEQRLREIEELTVKIDSGASDAATYTKRGLALYFEQRYEEAQSDMLKAFEQKPKDPELYQTMSAPFRGEWGRKILEAGIKVAGPDSDCGARLQLDLANTYWYDGDFSPMASVLQELVSQRHADPFMLRLALSGLALAYSALGLHDDEEATLRRALEVESGEAAQSTAVDIVKSRMHRGWFEGALSALRELQELIPSVERLIWEAALGVLAEPQSIVTIETCHAALEAQQATVRPPRGSWHYLGYDTFLLGLVNVGAGRIDEGKKLLKAHADESEANPTEWGVTMQWEIAKARELLAEP
jgi:tetratricopeptide (TPR) repeat protein